MSIEELCNSILGMLEQHDRPVVNLLNGPATSREINKNVSESGYEISDSARMLFQWRNGTRQGVASYNDMDFIPGFFLLDCGSACKLAGDICSRPELEGVILFPLLRSSGTDCYAINLAQDDSSVYFFSQEGQLKRAFTDINSMLRTIEAAYTEKGFYLDSGNLEVDWEVLDRIVGKFNPGIDRWV